MPDATLSELRGRVAQELGVKLSLKLRMFLHAAEVEVGDLASAQPRVVSQPASLTR